MLGRALMPRLTRRHEVTGTDLPELDVTDPDAVRRFTGAARPELVLHAAAMTQVDGCEKEPERAMRVNGEGTRNVAHAAREAGAAMIYISTDFVFDGRKGEPYLEEDAPHPLSVYGASKLAGEEAVRSLVPEHLVVRTSWLYGAGGPNFVEAILRAAGEGRALRVVSDQVGSPTYTEDLAEGLATLTTSGLRGVLHLTNSGACSWHEYACTILAMSGRGDVPVASITSAEWAAPATRPAYSVLANAVWLASGFAPLRPWREALADYLAARSREKGGSR